MQSSDIIQPNILFFFPDQHRGDWTELTTKLPVKTPNLSKLASTGVAFAHAICPSPLCAPSRACLALGKEYDHVPVTGNHHNCPINSPLFYKQLQDSGYHTMGCGKFDLNKPMRGWGRDGQQIMKGVSFLKIWGFSDGIDNAGKPAGARNYFQRPNQPDPYLAYLETKGLATIHMKDIRSRRITDSHPSPLDDEDYADNYIARNGLMLLDRAPKDKPWFIQVNFNGPHDPWDAPKSVFDRWQNVEFPPPNDSKSPPRYAPEKMKGVWRNYAAEVENIDAWLGKYLEKIKERGELENTLIVYSSDHGEMLGDHGLVHKSQPYHPSVNVPLVISGPGIKKRPLVQDPVALINLAPTFIEYAKGTLPTQIQKSMDASSIKPYLEGISNLLPKYVRSGYQHWRMVMRDHYKLITGYGTSQPLWHPLNHKRPCSTPEILFDLDADPGENNNIATKNPEIVQELKARLFS